jgi:phage N-6-adenine-methyltransferase
MTELKLIDLDKVDDHPNNPRIVFRQEVIDAIVANLDGEWPPQHALHVRPVGDRYQIVSGHTRKRAAQAAGISQVWCWVEELDDDDAFMLLVTENSQGELSPLEYGMHALQAVDNRRGKKGGGLQKYAALIGKSAPYVTQLRQAAEVASVNELSQLNSFLDKTQHLSAVHRAPEEVWPALCEVMVEEESDDDTSWTVKHTEAVVADIRVAATLGRDISKPAVKAASARARLARERGAIDAPHVSHNSGENEWYTPPEFIEAARAVMGGIDLDPASSAIAQRTVQAERFYTKDDDGLTKEWCGRVWLNPPYSSELIGQFAHKVAEEWAAEHIEQAVVLVNNATETQWFRTLASVATSICFVAGRVRFLDPDGNPGAPLQGQAALYIGAERERFADAFCKFGFVAEIARSFVESSDSKEEDTEV